MKKKYIIIGSIFLVYLVLMIVIFGTGLFKNETYMILGSDGKIKYDKGYVDMNNKDYYSYHNQQYDVYDDNGHLGKNKIKFHRGKWYVFDKNDKFVKINGEIFAIKSNKKYSVLEYDIEEFGINDLNILDEILSENKLTYNELSLQQKVSVDIDNDGTKENLYAASNLYVDNTKNLFSLIYYVKDNKINILAKEIVDAKDAYDGKMYTISRLIDLKDNQKVELITKRSCYSYSCNDCYEIYQLKHGKYEKIKTCK